MAAVILGAALRHASSARGDDALPPFGGLPLAQQDGSIQAGGFVFQPLVAVRTRAEVWSTSPLTLPRAVLAPDATVTIPSQPDALIAERSRIGIAAERGPVSAKISLQDAREFGSPRRSVAGAGVAGAAGGLGALGGFSNTHGLPRFEPYEAYLDVHTSNRQVFFRVGRQEIQLGDGRLIGTSDGSPTGLTLDAARVGGRIKNWDLQAFFAMLEPPTIDGAESDAAGSQLYAIDATWRIKPFFAVEVSALARISRGVANPRLSPSNTFVPWARLFGDHKGIRWSVVGAFEAGDVAVVGDVRPHLAGAVAGRFEWQTTLPGKLAFGVEGAFATGRDTSNTETETGFDPILPDTAAHFGQSGFVGWTNLVEAGADIGFRIANPVAFDVGYQFAGMPEPKGTWFSSALTPIGAAPDNDSPILGHIVSASARIDPLPQLGFRAEYSAMILGEGGSAILEESSGSDDAAIHYGMVEATGHFP